MFVFLRLSLLALMVFANPAIARSASTLREIAKRSDDSTLHELIKQQSAINQHQSAVIQQQSAVIQSLQAKDAAMEARMSALETAAAVRDGQLNKLGQKVAFTAFFTEGGAINIGESSPIPFSHVTMNQGNGYDARSGVFTAPTSGVYIFLLNVRVETSTPPLITIGLDKSGTILCKADSWAGAWDQLGCTIIIGVKAGEKVLAKHLSGSTLIDKWYMTSFSGLLLFAD